jgi:4-coumarate--CoA ligase (photoactive yellow protein activation family)
MPTEASRPAEDPPAWWAVDTVLLRFVEDLIAGELKVLRPGGGLRAIASPWDPALDIGRDLGADSLERLGMATALAEAIHLAESGIQDYLLARTTLHDWAAIAQSGLRNYSAQLTFRTSGSAGAPKSCTHTLATLEQEITELAPLVGHCTRIVTAVPSHHIYGFLFTILLPRRLGLAGVPLLDVRGSSPAGVQQALRAGDLIVGHPEFWRGVARVGVRIPPGVGGVSSTGPLPAGLGRELGERGLERLLQVYGSSETGGVGWRVDETRAYRLFSYWRRPDDASPALLRRLPDGQSARHALQDQLEWRSADEFLPAGRIDQAVQVAGTNVFPGRVRTVLLQHPHVAQAAVRLMRSDEGHRLKAFVVPKDPDADRTALRAQIDDWAAARLTTPEIPKSITFGLALPQDANGKATDWMIEAPRESPPGP